MLYSSIPCCIVLFHIVPFHATLCTCAKYVIDYVELIIVFGFNGNGLDRFVRFRPRAMDVYCGSGISDVELAWFYPNQTEVSYTDASLRQGSNADGAAILQFGSRRVTSYCDAGVYICKATLTTNTTSISQSRNFTLQIGSE